MRKFFFVSIAAIVLVAAPRPTLKAAATTCTPTGFFRDGINLTAAQISPVGTVTGTVNASGCNIGVYYGPGATGEIKFADIAYANYFGVVVDGSAGSTSVDILNSAIHEIGESPLNGSQHGVGIYYVAYNDTGSASGKVSGNRITQYQKGGIVINGVGSNVLVQNNEVIGEGHVNWIAQNGIQFGWGSSGSALKNTVTGNSYIGNPGDGSASGGILVVGGPGYGTCSGSPCALTTGVQVVQNVLSGNDVGVYLSNWDTTGAPADATNIKAVNNTISNDQCFNQTYQAGVSDVGNNDKIINNKISGAGYASPCGFSVDADTVFTNRPKVHANK